MLMFIPLTKPYWGKREEQAAITALRHSSGAGDGPYSRKLVEKLQKLTGSRFVFPVTSATHGLELAMVALGLKEGDEVIVPSFTMTSTANCVVLAGATPVFADIEDTYYCLDPADVRKKVSHKTRGVIFVSYAGMSGGIREIKEICRKHHLFFVEDAAHSIGAFYNKKALGTFGDVGVYSFHGTKNVSCGEGGAVLTNDAKLAEKMEIYRANGTNRAAFLAGIIDKYSWVGKGTSFFLSDILASIVISQISQINKICKKRSQIASFYTRQLQPYQKIIQLPQVSQKTTPNWHIYAIRFKKAAQRNIFLKKMRAHGIDVAYHYVPLHSSKMGRRLINAAEVANENLDPSSEVVRKVSLKRVVKIEDGQNFVGSPPRFASKAENARLPASLAEELPVTDRVAATLVRLPIYPSLTRRELTYIVSSARRVLKELK